MRDPIEIARDCARKFLERFNELLPNYESGDFTMEEFNKACEVMREEGYILDGYSKEGCNPHCWKCWTINLQKVNVGKCPTCGGYICPECGSCHQDCKENV